MAVSLTFGASAYNKPPPPEPIPDKTLFPTQLSLSDGRTVWVSVPQPDKLVILGDVRAEHFASELTVDAPGDFAPFVMSRLAAGLVGPVMGKPIFAKDIYWSVQVTVGGRASAVNFKIGKSKSSDAAHWLRMEFNPRKLGYSGVLDLLDGMHAATNRMFKVGAFLATSRVRKIDIALDLVGVEVAELLVAASGEGKRAHYLGADGTLESIYVYRKRKPPSSAKKAGKKAAAQGPGTLIVKIYDRVRERLSAGKPPPYGPSPVTRVEISKTRFGNSPFTPLTLKKLHDPFRVRVGHVLTDPPAAIGDWLRYVACRRSSAPECAAELLGLLPNTAALMEERYAKSSGEIIRHNQHWDLWLAGMGITGIGLLVAAAEHESGASHITDLNAKLGHGSATA